MEQKPHGHSLRNGRYNEAGRIYLITTVVADRRPIFHDLAVARTCIRILRSLDEANLSETLAFVLMPDHLHWLVTLKEGTLDDLMRLVKGASARGINQQLGTSGKVWQSGYHDHAVRRGEDLRSMARYVVANPVRAGLVTRVWDYPHWDAVWVGDTSCLGAQ